MVLISFISSESLLYDLLLHIVSTICLNHLKYLRYIFSKVILVFNLSCVEGSLESVEAGAVEHLLLDGGIIRTVTQKKHFLRRNTECRLHIIRIKDYYLFVLSRGSLWLISVLVIINCRKLLHNSKLYEYQ